MAYSTQKCVFPTCYFGPVHWYAAAIHEQKFVLEACQHYRKQTYGSRTYIKTANNLIPLVIPVGRKGLHTPIKDKRISYQEKWRQNHWRSLHTAYKNSPYFEYYSDTLEVFYQKKIEFLIDLQIESLHLINQALNLGLHLSTSQSYLETEYTKDYRQDFDGKLNKFPSWFTPAPYPQVFEGFSPGISILDLLFNEGPASTIILRDSFSDIS